MSTTFYTKARAAIISRINKLTKQAEILRVRLSSVVTNLPSRYIQVGLIALPSCLYTIRAWQYIRTPQLYAEDGSVWLADAYNHGWRSLYSPYNGFAHTTERLYGLLVSDLPLRLAPLLFNLAGFSLFVIMCYYLFSTRVKLFSNNYQRLFVASCLGLIANFGEFFFNFSNSIFLIGIIGLAIYMATPSKNIFLRISEKIIFLIACFTLPFAWFYFVVMAIEWLRTRRYSFFYALCAVLGSITQLLIHVFAKYYRPNIPLTTLVSSRYSVLEVYNQIITPGLRFARNDISTSVALHTLLVIVLFSLLFGLSLLFVTIKHASLNLKYLVLFLILFTIASFKGPLVGGNLSASNILKFMDTAQFGNRYFFYGILCVFVLLAVAASTYIKQSARYALLVLFILLSLISSLDSGSFKVNKDFVNYSNKYDADIALLSHAKPGKTISIPENPGGTWFIVLRAKQ